MAAPKNQRHLMVCVDGSEHSERCFHWFLDNVHRDDDLTVIVHAQEVPTLPAAPYPYGFAYYEEWQQLLQKSDETAKHLLEHYGKECKALEKTKGKKVECKLIKEAGDPGPVLVKNAAEEECSMIFMGCRGMGALRRTFLGSISDYVVHHSDIPVVVIPAPQQ